MFTDVLLDILGSSEFAVLNQSFTLTCIATHAAYKEGEIAFYQEGNMGSYGSLNQTLISCSEFTPPSVKGDTVSCGTGTTNISSTIKKYLLQINEVTDDHLTFWWCTLSRGSNVIFSNNFTLQLSSKS